MCKILKAVNFNDHYAFILDKDPNNFKFTKHEIDGNTILIGFDETMRFISTYIFDKPSGRFYAFGGRKFDLQMVDGSITHCYGQWWDGGTSLAEKVLGFKICHITARSRERLINCFVFTGYSISVPGYYDIIAEYENGPAKGHIYNYNAFSKGYMKIKNKQYNKCKKLYLD